MKFRISLALALFFAGGFQAQAWWGPFGGWMPNFFHGMWQSMAYMAHGGPFNGWHGYPPYAYAPLYSVYPTLAQPVYRSGQAVTPQWPQLAAPLRPAPVFPPSAGGEHSTKGGLYEGFDPFSMEPVTDFTPPTDVSSQWLRESGNALEESRARSRARLEAESKAFQQRVRERREEMRQWISMPRSAWDPQREERM